jgi:hypothetical protein
MTPPGCTLHLGDGHLLQVLIPDGIDKLGLFREEKSFWIPVPTFR